MEIAFVTEGVYKANKHIFSLFATGQTQMKSTARPRCTAVGMGTGEVPSASRTQGARTPDALLRTSAASPDTAGGFLKDNMGSFYLTLLNRQSHINGHRVSGEGGGIQDSVCAWRGCLVAETACVLRVPLSVPQLLYCTPYFYMCILRIDFCKLLPWGETW